MEAFIHQHKQQSLNRNITLTVFANMITLDSLLILHDQLQVLKPDRWVKSSKKNTTPI